MLRSSLQLRCQQMAVIWSVPSVPAQSPSSQRMSLLPCTGQQLLAAPQAEVETFLFVHTLGGT